MNSRINTKGYYFNKQYQKYDVRVYHRAKYHFVGRFDTTADAELARATFIESLPKANSERPLIELMKERKYGKVRV